jgi:predicted transcriptional regulator
MTLEFQQWADQLGLNRSQVSARTDGKVSLSAVCEIFAGKRDARLSTLERIAKAMGLKIVLAEAKQ